MASKRILALKLKMSRLKRTFPRYLSADYIPTGKPPNVEVIKEYKERSRSLAFDDEYRDYLVHREKMKGMYPHPGREEVEAHIKRIKETAPSLQCVTICNTVLRKTKLFYNQERSRFLIFEDNVLEKTVRTSMVYMDRQRCIDRWKDDTIRWVYFSSVRPPPPSD